jgi:ParB family transcriptional regulator, chromosome partitioning protein
MDEQILEIEVDKIKSNPYQPRKQFNEKELQTLADSIKTQGLFSPILVRNKEDYFEMACGERRLKAVKLNQSKKILAIVRRLTNEEMAEIGLSENLQRKDINPIEEAEGYLRLKDEFNYTQEQIAEKVGKSRVHIANRLRLLSLGNLARTYLKCKIISSAHGEALLGLKNKNIESNFTDLTWDWDINVRELRQMVRDFNSNIAPRIKREVPFKAIDRKSFELIRKIFTPQQEIVDNFVNILNYGGGNRPTLEALWFGKLELVYGLEEYLAYEKVGVEKVSCIIIFNYLLQVSKDRDDKLNEVENES